MLISDFQYTYIEETHCSSPFFIDRYRSLQAAKDACNTNQRCTMIFDVECDGKFWYTCDGESKHSPSTTTYAWIKGIFAGHSISNMYLHKYSSWKMSIYLNAWNFRYTYVDNVFTISCNNRLQPNNSSTIRYLKIVNM